MNILSKNEIAQINKYYGNKWYTYFFVNSHILKHISIIKKKSSLYKNLLSKYGKEWLTLFKLFPKRGQ